MKQHTTSKIIGLIVTILLAAWLPGARAADGSWTNVNGGNWSDTNNWLNGITADSGDGFDSTANFSTIDIPYNTNIVVTLDPLVTNLYNIANILFGDVDSATNSFGSWTIADGGAGLGLNATATSNSVINVSLSQGTSSNLATFWGVATINALISGTNTLVKSGPNRLTLAPTAANTYSGGTIISNGMIQLGPVLTATAAVCDWNGRTLGTSTSPIIFRGTGGSLRLQNGDIPGDNGGQNPTETNPLLNPIIVESGNAGTIYLSPRAFPGMNSVVTGGGTLNFICTFVRDNLAGDFSGFSGQLNFASATRGNSDMRWAFADPLTLSNVTVNITKNGINGNTLFGYSQMAANSVVAIGALNGTPGFCSLNAASSTGAGGQANMTLRIGDLNTDSDFGGNFNTTATGVINLIKEGTGMWTISGTNGQAGFVVVSNGVLRVGNGGAGGTLGRPTTPVTNYSTLVFSRSGTLAVSNTIDGPGTVVVSNSASGTVFLLATNTYTGITSIKAGTLAIPSQLPLGPNPVSFTANQLTLDGGVLRATNSFAINDANRGITLGSSGGTLSPDASVTLSIPNAVAGAGSLTIGGAGTVSLTSANGYTGKTILTNGTLALADETRLGVAPGLATADQLTFNGGTLNSTATFAIDDANRGLTFGPAGGTISVNSGTVLTIAEASVGTGALTKTGTGTLLFNGTSTRTGNTIISQGTYAIGAGGSVSGSPLITVSSGATLDVSAAGFTLSSGQTVGGNGTIIGNITAPSGSTLSAGTSVGILTINGNLTLSGGTNLVEISSTTNDLINVVGNLNIASASTINLSLLSSLPVGTYQLIKYSGTFSGSAANLTLGGYPLSRLAGSLVHNSGTKSIDLVISGTAAVMTWVGGANGNAWDTATTTNWLNGGNLDFFFNGDSVTFDNTGAANANVNLSGNLSPAFATVNSSTDYTLAGTGKLTGLAVVNKSGSDKLTVLTTNDYTGGTTISTGTIQVGNGTASGALGTGSIVDNAALTYNVPGTLTVPNAISGTGSLTVQGGTVALTANNSYGTSTINSGTTLQVGNGGSTGSVGTGGVSDNGALVYKRSGTVTNNGAISGNGSLTIQGSGTVALASDNSYAGPTTVDTGVLQVGIGGISGTLGTAGSVTLTNGGTVAFNRSDDITNIVSVLGTNGTLGQFGSGTLVITNDSNSYGPTLITGGKLQIGNGVDASGSLGSGTVTANTPGALVFNRPDTNTFSNTIAGSGSVVQIGAGALTFLRTSANTYSGGTTISNDTIIQAIPAGLAGQTRLDALNGAMASLGTGAVTFQGTNAALQLILDDINDLDGSFSPTFANALIIPSDQIGTLQTPGRYTLSSTLNGAGTFNLRVNYVRGDVTGVWTNFFGQVNILNNNVNPANAAGDLRWANNLGMPNAKLHLAGTVTMYSRAGANQRIPIGELTGDTGTSLRSTSGGASSAGVNEDWVIGGANTDATYDGTLLDGNSFTKVGTGKWTLTAANSFTGTMTVSNGVLAFGISPLDGVTVGTISSASSVIVASPGVLDASGYVDNTFVNSLSLGGNGTIKGAVYNTGTLSPGLSTNIFGNLTITSNLLSDGTINFKVDHVTAAVSDRLTSTNIIANGVINVTQVSTNDLQTGDVFQLFSSRVDGNGTNLLNLPVQNFDGSITYVWTNKLAIDGSVVLLTGGAPTVNTTPTNIVSTVSGNQLTLAWPVDHTGWRLQVQTNSVTTGLSGNWVDVAGSTTVNSVTVTLDPAVGTVFYRMVYP